MWDAVLEALIDSLKALPILFIVYFLIELLEHKGEVKFEKMIASSKKTGPLWGAGIGCIPQCGFSAVMADLFSRKIITIGTLFAVFIATSDEAFAILISNPGNYKSVLALLGCKFVLAVIFGYAIDLIFRKQTLKTNEIEHTRHFQHEHTHKHTEHEEKNEINCETCEIEEQSCTTCAHNNLHHKHEFENEKTSKGKVFWHIVLQSLKHTAEIFAWILIANLLINIIIQLAGGEDALSTLIGTKTWYQPFICSLLGLIPNCAGSVALVELYTSGLVSFASCLGGLCTGAGIGLLILFKNNKNIKQNLLILATLYFIGVVVGLIFNLFMPFSL